MTKTETTTRKVHELKGGDVIRVNGTDWFEVFDIRPLGDTIELKLVGPNCSTWGTYAAADAVVETR